MRDILIGDGFEWIHITNPTEDDKTFIANKYSIHKLILKNLTEKYVRPKLDIYKKHSYSVIHFPFMKEDSKRITIAQLDMLWNKNFLITITYSRSSLIPDFFNSMKTDKTKNDIFEGMSVIGLIHSLFHKIYEYSSYMLDKIEDLIDEVNEDLFKHKKTKRNIERISLIKNNTTILDTIFKPQIKLTEQLLATITDEEEQAVKIYIREINSSMARIYDIVEDQKEFIRNISETFDSLLSNRTSEVIKVLTMFSVILTPLSLITGFFGMNLDLPLESNPFAYLFVIMGFSAIIIIMLIFFKIKKWL
jgi:magnesium transporter